MSEATDKLVEVEGYIESLRDDITSLEEKLATLQEQTSDARSAKEKAEEALEAAQRVSGEQRQRLGAEINAIIHKKDKLLVEQKSLEMAIADMKTQVAAMNKKVADFKTYESRAMQVLRSKEASLMEREKTIREKESLSPLLPQR